MTDNPLSPDDPRGNLPPGMRGVPGEAQSKGKARQTVFLKKRHAQVSEGNTLKEMETHSITFND